MPFVDCGVARGAVPPELTRYLDAVGGPNRLIVKRDGILRIESIGGFAEFVRPNGPSTDPTVEKPINGIVTITNDAGEVVAVIDLSSLPRTDARNRSYSCQTSGPIYYVTRNTFGQATRIDVAVNTGIYGVTFTCSNCTQEGSAVTEAFFAPDTYTDASGREHEQFIMRHRCAASAGVSYCFCHTENTDMATMNTTIRFSFDPHLPDDARLLTSVAGPLTRGDSTQVGLSVSSIRQTPQLTDDTLAVTLPPDELMDLLVTGPAYFSLAGTRSQTLSDVPYSEIDAGNVWLVAGELASPSAPMGKLMSAGESSATSTLASLSLSGCGFAASADVEVDDEPSMRFDMSARADTLYLDDTTILDIRVIDAQGNEVSVDHARFSLSVTRSDGGDLEYEGMSTTQIEYDLASANPGAFQFRVADTPAPGITKIGIRVESHQLEIQSGIGYVWVVPYKISFVNLPDSLVPTLVNTANVDGNENENNIAKSIAVRLEGTTTSVAGEQISVSASMRIGSGGHLHGGVPFPDTTRLPLRYRGLFDGAPGPVSGTTDQDGELGFDYTASRVGGWFYLDAVAEIDGVRVFERDSILVSVPDLLALPESDYYELTGAPQNHAGTNDPCRPTPPEVPHAQNINVSSEMASAIEEIARQYFEETDGTRIRVNDASLPFGGLFDVSSSSPWQRPHAEHRNGNQADIGFTAVSAIDTCVGTDRTLLNELIENETNAPTFVHNDHFHIRTLQ